ncbi:MAG: Phenylalanine--tRNA ligase beta subunit [Candidatus Anoxychlamydiales bacterium]|nr:Phenylalanine--tRNA ligase beta subunit [Candidatus Anoxychlamydiales bacterium]NGX35580.1 Phenylalanine--tRNA ligase beta subunit [Candidatus Anoxychlamydiales bacterium]
MRITLSLLNEFLNLKKDVKEIAHLLTMAGVEVEKIENEEPSFRSVVSAKILDVQKHPSADKLVIVQVTDGKDTYQVVCGDPTCQKDQIVALAKVGATLKDEKGNIITIKKSKLRDVESFGMLASASELKLFDESDKVLRLDEDFEIGKDLSSLNDPVFDISLTPNLGHLLSAIGIAREIACLTKQKITMPPLTLKEDGKDLIEKKLKVTIEDRRSKRYVARILEDVKIKASPFWLKKELEASGFRSINNVVDAINYTMLKFNHPMHGFDANKIENGELKVSTTTEEIDFESLDKEKRKIPKDTLVIKDGKKTVAIAGVIGGQNSAVDENTKTVILEAAHFDPSTVRKTCRELNLKTQSSIRFEKSIDPNMIPIAIDYAAALINEISNSKTSIGKIDVKKDEFLPKKLTLRVNRVKSILGTSISENEIQSIFERLEFTILEMNDDVILLEVPTYRNDIEEEIDLIEEVARIFGYNNLAKVKPYYRSSTLTHSAEYLFEKKLKSYLRSCSLQELKTCDLISPNLAEIALLNLEAKSIIEVKHFKSIDQSILRPTLLPSLLEVVRFNHDHKNFDVSAYEISKIHFKNGDDYIERPTLSIILSGKRTPHIWDKSNFDINFYDLKGILENILSASLNKKFKFKTSSLPGFHPTAQASLSSDEKKFGIIAQVHPQVLSKFDIKKRVFFAEIDLSYILKNQKESVEFQELAQYPSSTRDLTISLGNSSQVQEIFDIIDKMDSTILEKTYLLDIFKSLEDKKNVTFRFIYRDANKTVSSEEVENEHIKITKIITKHLEK